VQRAWRRPSSSTMTRPTTTARRSPGRVCGARASARSRSPSRCAPRVD
jgi:hypothetical protein